MPQKNFSKLVDLAHGYSLLIMNDAAYAALTFHKEDQFSIFNVDGGKEVALELHSMSKGFNVTEWQLSWICRNFKFMAVYAHVKDQTEPD
jgi:LL-diaminopimelate aminotransferase